MIILSDQAMPALIPTENKTCPAILRVEGGDLQEICNNFCRILSEFALPPGSIILFSSMSHLHTEGLVNYTAECINVVRRFNSMFKDKCVTIPISPTPLCGIPDADCVRNLLTSLFGLILLLATVLVDTTRWCGTALLSLLVTLIVSPTTQAGSISQLTPMSSLQTDFRGRAASISRVQFPPSLKMLSRP